jgi:hypothetical protein
LPIAPAGLFFDSCLFILKAGQDRARLRRVALMSDLFKTILGDIRAAKNRFNRLLGVGTIFILLGHFYVLEPYFAYKAQEVRVRQALTEREETLGKLSDQVERTKRASEKAHATLAELRRRIEQYPDHLRNTLPEIDRAVRTGPAVQSFAQTAPVQVSEMVVPPHIKTFEAGVQWYVEQWFEQLLTDLQNGVVNPIAELELDGKGEERLRLRGMTRAPMERIRLYLAGIDPDFWRTYSTGKVPVARDLQQVMRESFGPLEAEVTEWLKKTTRRFEVEKKAAEAMRAELEKSREQQKKLESRITSLESPMGRLPLSLPDLIVLFPLLLVVIVVMVVLAFKKSGELCVSLWEPFVQEQNERGLGAFRHYTDCWFLPPYSSVGSPLVLIAWFMGIAVIFARGAFLIFGEPELFASLTGELNISKRNLFNAAYLLGCVVILASACTSFLTVRRLSRHISQRSPVE